MDMQRKRGGKGARKSYNGAGRKPRRDVTEKTESETKDSVLDIPK